MKYFSACVLRPASGKSSLRFAAFLLCFLAVAVARPKKVVNKTVANRFHALALDKQKLTGLFGSRLRANSEGFLENIDLPAMLAIIGRPKESVAPVAPRFPGLFLDAAADAFEYNHELQLRSLMDSVASALVAATKTAAPLSENRLTEAELLDARSDLIGLLAYHRATNDAAAYAAAQTIGSTLVKALSAQIARQDATPLAGAELIEPLLRLHRLSGEKKYLDCSLSLAQSLQPLVITAATPQDVLVGTLHALAGLADLYAIVAGKPYLNLLLTGWNNIVETRLSVTGALFPADHKTGDADACASTAWLELNDKLLRMTGQMVYASHLERTIYNQVLAAQDSRNGRLIAAVPFNGAKSFQEKLQAESGLCMLAAAKALAMLPQLVWGRVDNGIAINLYTSGRAFFTLPRHGIVQIYSEASFPELGRLQLHVETGTKPAKFPLYLRVPEWASRFTVDIAGNHLEGKPGEEVIVAREWRSGDTVQVSMDLPVRALPSPDGSLDAVLQRGPQILVLGKTLNPNLTDLGAASVLPGTQGQLSITSYDDRLPRNFGGEQVYRVAGEVSGKRQELLLVPLADAFHYRTSLHVKRN